MSAKSETDDLDRTKPKVETVRSMDDLRRLYEIEHNGLVRLAFLMTGSHASSEEVVHDAFLSLFEHREQVRSPGAYLRRVVINNCRSRHRRNTSERNKLAIVERDPLRSTVTMQPDVAELWELVRSLRPRQRAVIVLRFYADFSLEDISIALDMRLGTVKSTLHRSLNTMRKELS